MEGIRGVIERKKEADQVESIEVVSEEKQGERGVEDDHVVVEKEDVDLGELFREIQKEKRASEELQEMKDLPLVKGYEQLNEVPCGRKSLIDLKGLGSECLENVEEYSGEDNDEVGEDLVTNSVGEVPGYSKIPGEGVLGSPRQKCQLEGGIEGEVQEGAKKELI